VRLLAAAASTLALASPSLPGADSVRVCAAAGPYWPTMTLALQDSSAWVACKEQSRVVRVSTSNGKTLGSLRLRGQAVAVVSGLGAVWALDSGGTLYRISPKTGKVAKRISLPTRAAYNLWIGGGSVWAADDQGAQVVRVSPKTNRVVARASVGDGPADIAFAGDAAWVIDHRDRTLFRIDLRTSKPRPVAVIPGDAPERMVYAGGALWITGRGTDLLKVDPATGSVAATIDIGASGIDVVVNGDDLWVPSRSDAVDRSGFPTMETLKHVSVAGGEVRVVSTPTSRVDVHGLVAVKGSVWLADNTNGFLYRVPG
jgi:glutamine cyclotransferase